MSKFMIELSHHSEDGEQDCIIISMVGIEPNVSHMAAQSTSSWDNGEHVTRRRLNDHITTDRVIALEAAAFAEYVRRESFERFVIEVNA